MNLLTDIEFAREAIIMGETQRGLSLLLDGISTLDSDTSKKFYQELSIYSNNLNQLGRSKRLDTISNEAFSTESNRINKAIIETISEIEKSLVSVGIVRKSILTKNGVPRNSVPDKIYYNIMFIGVFLGAVSTISFFIIFFFYLNNAAIHSLSMLLFIGSMGVCGSLFLCTSFDALNRRKDLILDWKIITPHIVFIIGMLVLAGILTII